MYFHLFASHLLKSPYPVFLWAMGLFLPPYQKLQQHKIRLFCLIKFLKSMFRGSVVRVQVESFHE